MDDSLLSSPAKTHQPKENWDTPTRANVRLLRRDSDSYNTIVKKTGLKRSTIQGIVKSKGSRTLRKGKATKKKLLSTYDIKRMIRWLTRSWENRRAPYHRLKAALRLNVGVDTIRKTLKAYGFRRCVACRRPFINEDQAARREAFAKKYRWWGTVE